ncbi:unnamed protein product, partial [Amoebophrya sp. A25]
LARKYGKAPQIVYATRTHGQMTQIVNTLRESPYRSLSLQCVGSRSNAKLCANTKIRGAGKSAVTDCRAAVRAWWEKELTKSDKVDMAANFGALLKDTSRRTARTADSSGNHGVSGSSEGNNISSSTTGEAPSTFESELDADAVEGDRGEDNYNMVEGHDPDQEEGGNDETTPDNIRSRSRSTNTARKKSSRAACGDTTTGSCSTGP